MSEADSTTDLKATYVRLGSQTKRRLAERARRKTMPAAVLLRIILDDGLDRMDAEDRDRESLTPHIA